jgi:two-component system, CitB family, sensor kinase
MPRIARRLWSQIFVFHALIFVASGLLGFVFAVHALQRRLDYDYERRALGIARTVAATPEIVRGIATADRSGAVQRRAEAIRRATGVSSVVVTNSRGIRYSHPVPSRIGERVSTDPSRALAGETVLAVETGTLGPSARAKVPLRDGRRIIGIVSVTVVQGKVRAELTRALPTIAAYTGAALSFGLLASLVLARRLKRQTFGLELREIADLLQEREAMLHGIREGVVAIDARGRVRVVNDEARRLLDLPGPLEGRPVGEIAAGGRLAELLGGKGPAEDRLVVHGDRVLVASRMPARRDGRELGTVVTLRDRTELEALARELSDVRGFTEAMRAQAHEFSNRLHTLSMLLEMGHSEQALGFIREISQATAEFKGTLTDQVDDPRVIALLLAKSTVAAERGVVLRLDHELRLAGELTDAPAALTVLGNLVDNALDAARAGTVRPGWVEVGLSTPGDGALLLRVADSGPGVPEEARVAIFEPGWSTKPPGEVGARGVGLSLVSQVVERYGGDVEVHDAGDWGGALFEVRLPEAVRESARPVP